jgi:hypothetical protein
MTEKLSRFSLDFKLTLTCGIEIEKGNHDCHQPPNQRIC